MWKIRRDGYRRGSDRAFRDAADRFVLRVVERRVGRTRRHDAAAGSTLDVRWTVDQSKAKPPVKGGATDDLTKHTVPVDLTLTLNGHPHTVSLEANAATPSSAACSRVSFFYAGINILFQLDRADAGRATLTRTQTSESASTKT